MAKDLNLDKDAPDKIPAVLDHAADAFYESASELSADWQDRDAGKIWDDFAKIMEKAADQCRKALRKRGL